MTERLPSLEEYARMIHHLACAGDLVEVPAVNDGDLIAEMRRNRWIMSWMRKWIEVFHSNDEIRMSIQGGDQKLFEKIMWQYFLKGTIHG